MLPQDSRPVGPASRSRRLPLTLYVSTGFWGVSVGLWSAALPFRFLQLGLPIVEYGVSLSVYAAAMLLTESVWGALAFRLGKPGWLGALGLAVGGATVLLGLTTTFYGFVVALAILGAVGVYLAPILRWVSLSYQGPGSEGSGTGRWSSVFGLGLAVGVSLGPLVFAQRGFLAVAAASALTLAVTTIAAMALPWHAASLPVPAARSGSRMSRLARRPFVLALVLVALSFVIVTFATNFLQYYSTVLFGGTPSEAGYVLGAGRLVSLAASFLLGTFVDRWGASRTVPMGFLLLLVGGLGTWASHSYAEMVAATLVFFAGFGWLSAGLLPMALHSMPVVDQGTAIGVFGSMEDAGLLVGPLLFGGIWAADGARSIFPVVSALSAAGLAAGLLVAYGGGLGAPETLGSGGTDRRAG